MNKKQKKGLSHKSKQAKQPVEIAALKDSARGLVAQAIRKFDKMRSFAEHYSGSATRVLNHMIQADGAKELVERMYPGIKMEQITESQLRHYQNVERLLLAAVIEHGVAKDGNFQLVVTDPSDNLSKLTFSQQRKGPVTILDVHKVEA